MSTLNVKVTDGNGNPLPATATGWAEVKASIPTLAKRHAGPRLFTVKWDNSKTKTRDTRKHEKHEAFGTVYPNGLVTLDNGTIYATMSELHHLLDLKGQYEIAYLDEQEAAQ